MPGGDRKSTRLNSSHANISYAVFCLKKKKKLAGEQAQRQASRGRHEADEGEGTVNAFNRLILLILALLLLAVPVVLLLIFFFNDTATTEIYTLSLHDALPISSSRPTPPAWRWCATWRWPTRRRRSEEHTSELQSRQYLVCRLLLEKKKNSRLRSLPHIERIKTIEQPL